MNETKRKVPKLRFPGFTEDWEQRKLGEVVERVSCTSEDSEIPQVEYEDIISGEGRLNKDITKKLSNKKGILFRKGDVLYGKLRPYLKNWLLPDFSGKAVGDFWVLRSEKVQSSFLYNLIQSNRFELASNQSTGTKMPRADWNLVANTEFPVPVSIEEQISIGNIFKLLNNSITLHQRKLENLKLKKKALLQKLFPKNGEQFPELRFPGFTDAWEQRKSEDIFKSITDKGHSGLPVLSASQEWGMIRRDEGGIDIQHDKANENTYKRVLPGQFVIHLRSFQGGFAYSEIEGITSPAYTVIDFKNQSEHYPLFWKHVFKSSVFIKRLETITYGIRDGRSISFSDFKTLSFRYPTLDEQKNIADSIEVFEKYITLHQRKLEHLQLQKKSLLQLMFV